MKPEYYNYLDTLGISPGPVRDKVERVFQICKQICPDEICDMFITEYMQNEGGRIFENLFWISPSYLLEAKLFLHQDSFDITPLRDLHYFEIQAQDYDFQRGTDKSRLTLHARFSDVIVAQLRGSGTNCDQLNRILLTHFKPNIKS